MEAPKQNAWRFFKNEDDEMAGKNSSNDYLEKILILNDKKGFARSTDLANELGVTKPTVSNTVKRLCERGLTAVGEKGYIFLTDTGRDMAERIHKKHKTLTKKLIEIGVDENTADIDACRMIHAISDETYICLNRVFKLYAAVSGN